MIVFLRAGLLANLTSAFYNVYVRKLVPTDTSGIANSAGIMTTGQWP